MYTLSIKNMVCNRCILAVQQQLAQLGIVPLHIQLGEVTLANPLALDVLQQFSQNIQAIGFELIDDRKTRIAEQIKNTIIQVVHYQNNQTTLNLSDLLTQNLQLDYKQLATIFTEVTCSTIEKYYIAQRIEKVKELLLYNQLSLSEIAYQLNYSSVGYLSNQFKKVTGVSPTAFKNSNTHNRRPLDQVK